MPKNNGTGILYIIATPIGNYEDITLRAIRLLNEVDIIICEETRQATTLFKKINITPQSLVSLTEHNEKKDAGEFLQHFFLGKNIALISDCGTPVFSDPGRILIETCISNGIRVVPVPGASSLMATLSSLDFPIDQFFFAGFLPRESGQRDQAISRLKTYTCPIVLMDTPYRLGKCLEEMEKAFGKNTRATLACDLTLPTESIIRDSLQNIKKKVGARKAEFLLVILPPRSNRPDKKTGKFH